MVPMEGVEPTHPHGYQILSLARLPIPPHRPPINSMLFAAWPLLFFHCPHGIWSCNLHRSNSRVPGNARNTCQRMASGARFRKCRICSNTLSVEITLGKLKLVAKRFAGVCRQRCGTTAQLRRNDCLKEHRENRNKVEPPKFSEAVDLFKAELASDSTMKASSKEYRLDCITKLQRTWPELWDLDLTHRSIQELFGHKQTQFPSSNSPVPHANEHCEH